MFKSVNELSLFAKKLGRMVSTKLWLLRRDALKHAVFN